MLESGKLGAFLRVSRANLLLTSIGHATLGLLLGAGFVENLAYIGVPLFIILHFSIATFGCNINCYFDHDVDKRYKTDLSESVNIIGKKNLALIIFIESLAILFLISIIIMLGHHIVGILGLLGFISALIYSAEPIRLKRRGIFSLLPIMFGLYLLPILGGWFIFQNALTVPFIIFIVGYALMNQGFTFVNTVEDYSEDRSEGIRTWAHVFGMKNTLDMAFLFSIFGLLSSFSLTYIAYMNRGSTWSYIAILLSLLASISIILAAIDVEKVRHGKDLELNAKRYGPNLQKWFMMGRYPLMLAAFILLL